MVTTLAPRNEVDCVRDLMGYCSCADCRAVDEAEAESEFLAEVGATYAYSGFNASDSSQMAREDLRYRKMRNELPEMRRRFAAIRATWFHEFRRDVRRSLVDEMTALTVEAIRAESGTWRDYWAVYGEVVDALIAWEAKAF